MTTLRHLFSVLALLLLAACGGGGNTGGTPFGGPGTGASGGGTGATPTPTPTIADLVVVLSAPTIPNTGASTATVTITALDANRNAVSGAAVSVSANANAVVTINGTAGSVTNASGVITAAIGVGADRTNRDITITASANGITRTAVLKVVDSTVGAVPSTIDLIADATTLGTGGETVIIRAFVKDVNNNALPSTAVTFRTDTGTLSSVSVATDTAGVANATLTAGANKTNRNAVITVTAGAVTSRLTLPITGTTLKLSGPSSLIIGATATFDITVFDSRNNVVPGVAIGANSPLGNVLSPMNGVTNENGQVSFSYAATRPGTDALVFSGANATVSPSPALVVSGQNFAFVSPAPSTQIVVGTTQPLRVQLVGGTAGGNDSINFTATGGTLSATTVRTDSAGIANVNLSSTSAGPITVQASATISGVVSTTTLPLVIVATTPAKLTLQISPSAIAPNTQTQVVAKVTDLAGNPVQGKIVNFSRDVDPSGGNLQQPSAPTDASGQATVSYRAGSESTANNGVVLRGSVADALAVTGSATLTVNQTALFIALGTGNVISNADEQTYRKDWTVYVTDSNGIAVNGVTLTIKALPTFYRTGRLDWDGTVYAYVSPIYSCRNEDANANGVLDAGVPTAVTAITTGVTTILFASNTFAPGQSVYLQGFNGTDGALLNGRTYQILSATSSQFVVNANTSGRGITVSALSQAKTTEDDNNDGVLWPGNVIAVSPGTVQTVNGRATVSLTYAESYAPWVQLKLTASATVSGTESKTDAEFIVSGSGPDFSNQASPPAGRESPFGLLPKIGASCTQVQLP